MLDEHFEFDAPQYFDFASQEPESPSKTDAWFDSKGKAICLGILSRLAFIHLL